MNCIRYAELIDRMTLIDELETLSQEVTLTYSKVLHRYLPRQTKVDHGEQQMYLVRNSIPGPPKFKLQFFPFCRRHEMKPTRQ